MTGPLSLLLLAQRQVQVAVAVDLGHDGHDRHAVVYERNVVTHPEFLVAVECALMDHRPPINDRVELDWNVGPQYPGQLTPESPASKRRTSLTATGLPRSATQSSPRRDRPEPT